MEEANIGNIYRKFIAQLKILYIRAKYNGEKEKEEYYRNIYERLELVRERRHLALIGEECKEKKAFREILEVIWKMDNKSAEKGENEVFESTANYINKLLNDKYEIKIENRDIQKEQEKEIVK